jgi:subtilisin family serine protease
LSAALLYTTVGGMVGLFQLLYAETQSDIGVDDYGLSMARIIVAPQIAGVAALVGVVVTSLTTSTLSGTPATAASIATIADALNQIRNPANILVAVAFGLSPGLVFSRFRQSVEQTKRELSRTSAQS